MFAFASDLVDEGTETVLDNVAARAGLGGVTIAAAYHQGRDIFPHNPARKVHFLEGDRVFFQPDPARYRGLALQPIASTLVDRSDLLADVCRMASARSLTARAWTVFLHNHTLGTAHPDGVAQLRLLWSLISVRRAWPPSWRNRSISTVSSTGFTTSAISSSLARWAAICSDSASATTASKPPADVG